MRKLLFVLPVLMAVANRRSLKTRPGHRPSKVGMIFWGLVFAGLQRWMRRNARAGMY